MQNNDDEKSNSHKSSYAVGKGKPPSEFQFQKGEGGPRKGRKMGSKNKRKPICNARLNEIMLAEANREIKIGEETIPLVRAGVRSMLVNSARGQVRSQALAFDMYSAAEREAHIKREEYIQVWMRYKYDAEGRIWEAIRLEEPTPDIHPHPDQISYDPATDQIVITGPITLDERMLCKKINDFIKERQNELEYFRQAKIIYRNESDIDELFEDDIARAIALIKRAEDGLRDLFPTVRLP